MSEGFKVEKGADKYVAKFQDIEMVSGGPVIEDVESAIEEIRGAGILSARPEARDGFGEFQAVLYPKGGQWPKLEDLPYVIQAAFERALEAERERNPHVDTLACHIGVRIQGDEKAEDVRRLKEQVSKEERELGPEEGGVHFDGGHLGELSEYLVAFTGPTTIQYLGETELPEGTHEGEKLKSALSKVSSASLRPQSLLPKHLYHFTHQTPHSEPTTLDTHVSDEKPRLFMRLMFGNFDASTGLQGRVYEA